MPAAVCCPPPPSSTLKNALSKRDPSVAAAHRPLAEDSEDVRNGHEAQRAEPRVRPVEIRDPQIAKERIGNLEARDDVPTLNDLLIGRTQSQ